MRKLILNPGNGAREFPVGKGITIGRDAANTIQLEGQKVQDKHAKVALKGNLIFVEDLDTPFGIVVNGKKVTRWALNKGDVIEIGGSTLAYDEDDKPEPAPPAKPKAEAKPAAPKAPAAKPSNAQVKPAAKPSAAKVEPAAKAAPSKPALKPASPAQPSSKAMPAAKKEPKSDIKIVMPEPPAKKKADDEHAPGPADGPERRTDPSSSLRIKLGAARDVLDDGKHGGEAPAPRSSLAKISLKNPESSSGASGRMPSASGRSSSSTSERMKLGGSKEIEREAVISKVTGSRRQEPLVKPMSAKTKRTLAIVGLVIVVVVSVVLLVPVIGGLMARSSAEAQHAQMLQETIDRLKASPVKDPTDVQTILPKLKLADTWEKVEALLGMPDFQSKGKVMLFNHATGVYELTGHSFKAYYIKDRNYPTPKEGDLAPIFLFIVSSTEKVSFLENDRLLCRNPDLKIVEIPPPITKAESVPPEGEAKTEPKPETP